MGAQGRRLSKKSIPYELNYKKIISRGDLTTRQSADADARQAALTWQSRLRRGTTTMSRLKKNTITQAPFNLFQCPTHTPCQILCAPGELHSRRSTRRELLCSSINHRALRLDLLLDGIPDEHGTDEQILRRPLPGSFQFRWNGDGS